MGAVGGSIWQGLADGRVKVYSGHKVREWKAHESGVISVVPCGSRVYTLAVDGSVHGWCSTSPTEHDVNAR